MLDSEQLSHHGVWRKSAHKAGAWQRPLLGGAGSRFPPRRGCIRGPCGSSHVALSHQLGSHSFRPAATPAWSAPPCSRLSTCFTVKGPHQDMERRAGDWYDQPLTNGREILTPQGKRLHPQETTAFAFSPIQHPGNSIFLTDQCGRGPSASSG